MSSKLSIWLNKKAGLPIIDLSKFIGASKVFGPEIERLKELAVREIAEELNKLPQIGDRIDSNKIKDALYARIQSAVTIPPFLEEKLSLLVAGYDAEKLEDEVTKAIPFDKIDKVAQELIDLIRGLKV